ncbi:rho GTPase [Aspergillus pseudoviridinutans]|uniref:Rho GTPase n=1 Tax=Aspergillus pseudoviridinutans TaxID=1517512 RepID=A0A9P3BGY5_9EURO|nr:rho GTPase [Aspergillus pseudoviridinutans]GIJ87659.1 rho GTPase [Aspergillus pseudoviridinutans]
MLISYSMQKAGHYWRWCLREDQFAECIYAWLFSNSNVFHFQHYVPTVFENYVTDCRVDGRSVQLALWDTAGQEDYERLRPLAYSKAHVILIGFAVDTPDSLENVKHKWIEEANERCPGVPIILVGLKKDLREDPLAIEEMRKKSLRFVTSKEGSETATQIGARKYLECSSLTGEGVDDVFEAATRAALLTFDKRKTSCCIVL